MAYLFLSVLCIRKRGQYHLFKYKQFYKWEYKWYKWGQSTVVSNISENCVLTPVFDVYFAYLAPHKPLVDRIDSFAFCASSFVFRPVK